MTRPTDGAVPWPGTFWAGIGAIGILAFGLRAMESRPLWADELASEWFAAQSAGFLFGPLLYAEPNPATYYLLLGAWQMVFGPADFSLRALSAVLSALTVVPLAALGLRWGGWVAGVAAALLFATLPTTILYGTEIRVYTALGLVFAIALLFADRATEPSAGPRDAVGLGASAGMLFWLHGTALFAAATLGCFILLKPLLARRAMIGSLRLPVAAGVLAAAIAAFPLSITVWFAGAENSPLTWIKPPTVVETLTIGVNLLRHGLFGRLAPAVLALWAVLLLLAAVRWDRVRPGPPAALIAAIAGLALLHVASWALHPVLVPRTAAFLALPLLLAASVAISRLRPPMLGLAVMIGLSAAGAIDRRLTRDHLGPHEDWPAAAALLGPTREPVLALDMAGLLGPRRYGAAALPNAALIWSAAPDLLEALVAPMMSDRMVDVGAPCGALTGADAVWLVGRQIDSATAMLATLERHLRPATIETRDVRGVHVRRFSGIACVG